jgi:hypothetical protein
MAVNSSEFGSAGAEQALLVPTEGRVSLTLAQIGPMETTPAARPALAGHSDGVPQDFGHIVLVSDAQAPAAAEGTAVHPGEAAAKGAKQVQPPRLDHFNATVTPADHFRWFAPGQVSASGRVHVGVDSDTPAQREADGEKNLTGLVERMHPDVDKQLDAAGATPAERAQALTDADHKTAIVELRTLGDSKLTGAVLQSNDAEMTAEEQAAKALGIDHVNFPMNSHDLQPPSFIATVVDYIHNENTQGKTVDIHCYHGTDRTGLIGQSELATYDPALQALLKAPGQAGVDQVYAQSIDSLLSSGVDPGDHTEIYQSMKQYLQYLHDGTTQMTFNQVPIAGDQGQIDALRDAAAVLNKNATMDNYMTLLRTNTAKFDPATYSAFYRQLYHEFNSDYVQQH